MIIIIIIIIIIVLLKHIFAFKNELQCVFTIKKNKKHIEYKDYIKNVESKYYY